VMGRQRWGLVDKGFIEGVTGGLGIIALGYFLPTVVCCVNGVLPVTRKMSLRCTFFQCFGMVAGGGPFGWGAADAYQMPTSKRPSNAQDASSGK
jgi:hypothetical protein